jgi:hypothetical protein
MLARFLDATAERGCRSSVAWAESASVVGTDRPGDPGEVRTWFGDSLGWPRRAPALGFDRRREETPMVTAEFSVVGESRRGNGSATWWTLPCSRYDGAASDTRSSRSGRRSRARSWTCSRPCKRRTSSSLPKVWTAWSRPCAWRTARRDVDPGQARGLQGAEPRVPRRARDGKLTEAARFASGASGNRLTAVRRWAGPCSRRGERLTLRVESAAFT